MAQTMPPSVPDQKPMTEGQINRAVSRFRTMLEKHSPNFDAAAIQRVLGGDFFRVMSTLFREQAEYQSTVVCRTANGVDRSVAFRSMIKASGRTPRLSPDMTRAIPVGVGKGQTIEFYPLDIDIKLYDIERDSRWAGTKPANPYDLEKINRDDPAFADTHPNFTYFEYGNNALGYVIFCKDRDERCVIADYGNGLNMMNRLFWIARVRK